MVPPGHCGRRRRGRAAPQTVDREIRRLSAGPGTRQGVTIMQMRIAALAMFMLTAAAMPPAAADTLAERANRGLVEVITGSIVGSSARMAEDLADVLDDGATRRVLPVIGKGSLQDLVDLKALRGVDLAILQTDVLGHVRTHRLLGIEGSVTYIAKLFNEEFHRLAPNGVSGIADLARTKANSGSQGDAPTST